MGNIGYTDSSGISNNLGTAVVDGLKGFPEAIAAVFPPTIVDAGERLHRLPEQGASRRRPRMPSSTACLAGVRLGVGVRSSLDVSRCCGVSPLAHSFPGYKPDE
jgi:hypothetical protein